MKQTKNNKLFHGVKKTAVASVIALSLYGANSFAGFENYDLSIYGSDDPAFWEHNYYTLTKSSLGGDKRHFVGQNVTHTGSDFNLDGGKNAHTSVFSYSFGKIIGVELKYNALTIQHLLDNGHYVNVNLLHFNKIDKEIKKDQYIVKQQLLGKEGNKGLGYSNTETQTHLLKFVIKLVLHGSQHHGRVQAWDVQTKPELMSLIKVI